MQRCIISNGGENINIKTCNPHQFHYELKGKCHENCYYSYAKPWEPLDAG